MTASEHLAQRLEFRRHFGTRMSDRVPILQLQVYTAADAVTNESELPMQWI